MIKTKSMKKITLLLRSAYLAVFSLNLHSAETTNATSKLPTNAPVIVSIFADSRLEDAVRQQVFAKRGSKVPLTAADVGSVSTVSAPFVGITNLAGLQHCRSLALLEIPGNRIADIGPLASLKQLQSLNLASNLVKNVGPLATVAALQYVELSHNQVVDITPMGSLSNLASVYLSGNRVSVVSALTNLTRLSTVYIDGNRVSSINGFNRLRSLSTLSAAGNRISDISPLTGLRAPYYLNLTGNRVRELGSVYGWMTNDLSGARSFAPFVRLYLKGNSLNKVSQKQTENLKKMGARIDPEPTK